MHDLRTWLTGVIFLGLFFIVSETVSTFSSYIYERIGLSKNIILLLLWITPIFVSYYVSSSVKNYNIIFGLSYIIIIPIIGGFVHYINTAYMGGIDFKGTHAILELMKIYGFIAIITSVIGTVLGRI